MTTISPKYVNFPVTIDQKKNNSLNLNSLTLPNVNVSITPVGLQGSLIYNDSNQSIYLSNGSFWNQIASLGPLTNTIYVSTTGNDSNPGTATAPVLTVQQGMNLLASQGYQQSGTLSIGAGTFQMQSLTLPMINGTPLMPPVIQGTLTPLYSGTVVSLSFNSNDPSKNYTMTGNVTASSASTTLRGDYLRMTSGLASGIGFFIVDNTQISSTQESYLLTHYGAIADVPVPTINPGDTYTIFTRATTLYFNGHGYHAVGGPVAAVWFKDINFLSDTQTYGLFTFQSCNYLFTDVAFNTTGSSIAFRRATSIAAGRAILSIDIVANMGTMLVDSAGIYVSSPPGHTTTFDVNNAAGRINQCAFQNAMITEASSELQFEQCVLNDSIFSVSSSTGASISNSAIYCSSAASGSGALQLNKNSSLQIMSCFLSATSPPAGYPAIVDGSAGQGSNSVTVSGCYITGFTDSGVNLIGDQVSVLSSDIVSCGVGITAQNCLLTVASCQITSNTTYGLLLYGTNGYISTSNIGLNGSDGIHVAQNSNVTLSTVTSTAGNNVGVGVNCQGARVSAAAPNVGVTITGTGGSVLVGSNGASVTWATIAANSPGNTSDFMPASAGVASPTYAIVRPADV